MKLIYELGTLECAFLCSKCNPFRHTTEQMSILALIETKRITVFKVTRNKMWQQVTITITACYHKLNLKYLVIGGNRMAIWCSHCLKITRHILQYSTSDKPSSFFCHEMLYTISCKDTCNVPSNTRLEPSPSPTCTAEGRSCTECTSATIQIPIYRSIRQGNFQGKHQRVAHRVRMALNSNIGYHHRISTQGSTRSVLQNHYRV